MPQFLYTLKLRDDLFEIKNWTSKENQIVTDHFNRLKDDMEKGIVILAGRTTNMDKSGIGIVIFNMASKDEAKKYMNQDPAVKASIMKAEVFSYKIEIIKQKNIT